MTAGERAKAIEICAEISKLLGLLVVALETGKAPPREEWPRLVGAVPDQPA